MSDNNGRFFYPDSQLLRDAHTTRIKFMQGNRNKDIEYFNHLVKSCFARLVNAWAQPVKLADIEIKQYSPARKFIANESGQISDLFLSEYYQFPDVQKLDPADRSSNVGDQLNGRDDIVDAFNSCLYDPKGLAVLIGDVGEGKSIFLSKLAYELRQNCSDDNLVYIPIIIDVQAYFNSKDSIEEVGKSTCKFWDHVRERIICYADRPYQQVVNNFTHQIKDFLINIDASLSFNFAIFDQLNVNVRGKFKSNGDKGAKRIFEPLRKISKQLDKRGHRLVLIFDNLDTFFYDQERYMFFESGYEKLNSKVSVIKSIYQNVVDEFLGKNESAISFIFTTRPYAYEQVFSHNVCDAVDPSDINLFCLKEIDSYKLIRSRLDMLGDLVEYIENHPDVKGGSKAALNANYRNFQLHMRGVNGSVGHKGEIVFNKLHKISNQGYRSIIHFYQEHLKYTGTRNFNSFFSHNILYMYMLDMFQAYSQVVPEEFENHKHAKFPNIFLVRGDSNCNLKHKEDCEQHKKPVYFLKYLILLTVYSGKKKIADIFELFDSYEPNITRLVLGSLSTVNESNCLQLKFPRLQPSNVDDFIASVSVDMTNRGAFFINNNYCFSFECLQLYFEDYLLMRPKKEHLDGLPEDIAELLDPNRESATYDYLLHCEEQHYNNKRESMIFDKVKKSLLLLSMLEAAKEFESVKYSETWEKVSDFVISEDKFDNVFAAGFFERTSAKIQREALAALGHSSQLKGYKLKIDEFVKTLDIHSGSIRTFYKMVYT